MLKISLTFFEKFIVLLDEIIGGLAVAAALFAAVIVAVAFWVIYQAHIQVALQTAQNFMFGG